MYHPTVSAIIPGRNCQSTIRQCLQSVVEISKQPGSALKTIIFVDDGSSDDTAKIVGEFPVQLVQGEGKGPGAARNLGWRAAESDMVWFVDSDCVAEPDALQRLLSHMDDPDVAAVSGSYGIMNRHSLLARLIHEEIIQRHLAMGKQVNFLATFNVLYRRSTLGELGGFDERYLKGQDAELSFRALEAGCKLHFEIDSRVNHFHEEHWMRYLRTQRQQGYWRLWLHMEHSGHGAGDSYSNVIDHAQPILAVAFIASVPLVAFAYLRLIPVVLLALLMLAQLPMTAKLVLRMRKLQYLLFAPMSFLRAFWRGAGMSFGAAHYFLARRRRTG